MRLRALAVAAATAAAALTSVTGAASAAPTGATGPTGPTRCAPTVPDGSVVALGSADNGRSLCLLRDQQVSVALSVDPQVHPDPANWWTSITEEGAALAPVPTMVMPVRGTTLGTFRAVQPGFATLSSTLSVCPPGYACGAPVQLWRVTVQVTARRH